MMQRRMTLREYAAILAAIFVLFCMWFVIVLISYAMFLIVKEVT